MKHSQALRKSPSRAEFEPFIRSRERLSLRIPECMMANRRSQNPCEVENLIHKVVGDRCGAAGAVECREAVRCIRTGFPQCRWGRRRGAKMRGVAELPPTMTKSACGECPYKLLKELEARAGIEPAHKGFADLSLTTWVPRLGRAAFKLISFAPNRRSQPGWRRRADWSGRRDLNSRPSPWQGDALPLSYSRLLQT